MSAIAGIIHFDGAPVERAELERMSQALQPFGRDGVRLGGAEGAGFVVRTTIITPEDRLDRQPVTLDAGGLLVFDGRLDNRPDLLLRLGLGDREGRALSDAALVGRVWERWGRDGLIHLIGMFALAHWDPAARRLTLARSAPQGKALYVHRSHDRLYFASAPQALFALPQIPRALNEPAFADLLLQSAGYGETLFRDIAQVRNAYWTEYRQDGEDSRCYWQPDRTRRLDFRREEEAWEAFRPLFAEVVEAHLRAVHPTGVQMSGGLDSAAVAGQAAILLARHGQTLNGYTRVPAPGTPLRPDGLFYNDERPRVELIAAMHPNLRPHFVHAGEEPVLDGLPGYFSTAYASFGAPTFLTGYDVLYRRAAADGVRVLLTGASGNYTLTYDGEPRLRSLLLSGRWPTLLRELLALKRRRSVRDVVDREILNAIIPRALRGGIQGMRNRKQDPWRDYSSVSREFAERSGALQRLQDRAAIRLHWTGLDSWSRRAAAFTRTELGGADTHQARFGIDRRDPTGDRRLVEFCMALPDIFYFRHGIERRFARLGLSHLIPEAVRLDPTRGRQDVDWAYRMKRDAEAVGRMINQLESDPTVSTWLDIPAMRVEWSRFASVDWRHAPLNEVIRCNQGLMNAVAVGQFVRWFEGRN